MLEYSDETIDISNAQQWVVSAKKSESGKVYIFDEFQSGRPKTMISDEKNFQSWIINPWKSMNGEQHCQLAPCFVRENQEYH